MPPIVFYLALFVSAFCLIALLASPFLFRKSEEEQRVHTVLSRPSPVLNERASATLVRNKAVNLAHFLRSHVGFAESATFKKRLEAAGIRKRSTADLLYAAQIALPIIGLFAGSFTPSNTFFWVATFAVAGYMAPDIWLTRQISKRKNKIRRSLPDAVDLLVICVGAGLGLDQALMRVGEELAVSYPETSEEFATVNLEQRAGKPRLEAWQSLSERTKIEEFASFTSMLSQTERFGTPIIKSLTRYSEELRMKRRQHAEEAAVKTKVKIIFPLVLFIFPCIFIVLLAPAILGLLRGLSGLGN